MSTIDLLRGVKMSGNGTSDETSSWCSEFETEDLCVSFSERKKLCWLFVATFSCECVYLFQYVVNGIGNFNGIIAVASWYDVQPRTAVPYFLE